MKTSSPASDKPVSAPERAFFAEADAAMRRAARKVAAENKRLGLPLIAEKGKRKRVNHR